MGSPLKVRWFDDVPARYRPGATDERVLEEVVSRAVYRRKGIGFDVDPGERWLDLGANIGAFAVYCKTRGATAECYEPEPECFGILEKNAGGFPCVRAAVSSSRDKEVPFYVGRASGNFARGSLVCANSLREFGRVPNVWAGSLRGPYDGVKMDVEGAEGPLIDAGLIPSCEKLCMEYHTSRDRSMDNLRRRIGVLKDLFRNVHYPPEYDRKMAEGRIGKTYFDRFIFCWGRK